MGTCYSNQSSNFLKKIVFSYFCGLFTADIFKILSAVGTSNLLANSSHILHVISPSLQFSFILPNIRQMSTIEILDLGRSPSLGGGVQEGGALSHPKMVKVLLYIILNASYTFRTYFKWPARLV